MSDTLHLTALGKKLYARRRDAESVPAERLGKRRRRFRSESQRALALHTGVASIEQLRQ